MEKKEITIVDPVTFAGINIIPVSKATINYRYGKRGVTFFVSKQPDSIIIATSEGERAFRISGEEVNIAQLIRGNPELAKKLREIR